MEEENKTTLQITQKRINTVEKLVRNIWYTG